MIDSMFCGHANEVPHECTCSPNCYCRVEGSCKNKIFIDPIIKLKSPAVMDFIIFMLNKGYEVIFIPHPDKNRIKVIKGWSSFEIIDDNLEKCISTILGIVK